jgi:putative CocE/NonD family hydrolase
MRDGVELLTDVYEPAGELLGTLLIRTPYGLTGPVALLSARYFATHGYQVVNQSCRGTFGSGGVFVPFGTDIDDGADTVAWLRNQEWFGGRFALWGASYVGATAWALMMDPPAELAAAIIGVSAHDNYWAVHGSGAFALDQTLGLLDAFDHQEQGGVLRRVLRGVTAGRRLKPGFEELPLVRAQDTVPAGSSMPYREWLTTTDGDDPVCRPMRLGQLWSR